jgi:plasmid stabilization system protein ParE
MYDLDGTIASLADSPAAKGISVNRAGVRRLRHRDHYFVFFRIVGDRVEVLRILHQRRDWPKILNNR